jgi:hypothetical protein
MSIRATKDSNKNRWRQVTWIQVLNDVTITALEHPFLNTTMSKEIMGDEFGAVLTQLDGATLSDFVDFFYRRDPVDPSILRFIGETERADIFDWAVEEGCAPPLGRIHDGTHQMILSSSAPARLSTRGGTTNMAPTRGGTTNVAPTRGGTTNMAPTRGGTTNVAESFEDALEKERRRVQIKNLTSPSAPKLKKSSRKKPAPIVQILCGRQKALAKLRQQLNQTVNELVRVHLQVKIAKAEAGMARMRAESM